MENLLVQISELLDMSVEGVIQYYPVLRNQLVAYNILSSIFMFFVILLLISPLVVLAGAMILDIHGVAEEDSVLNKRNIKYVVIFFVVIFILMAVTNISKHIMARDLIMLRQFL